MKKLLAFAVALLIGSTFAQDIATNSSDLGTFLTDSEGMTLYIFKKDVKGSGESTCYADCAAAWPPFVLEANAETTDIAGEFGMITRTDGSMQVTYNGWPLYYWAGDQNPDDTFGQGIGDVWFVAEVTEEAAMLNSSTVDYEYGSGY